MSTITKKSIIQELSKKHSMYPGDVMRIVKVFLESMTDCLVHGDRIEFRGFGVLEVVTRKQNIGRNPKNPKISVVIPERKAVKFRPGKLLKEIVEKGN